MNINFSPADKDYIKSAVRAGYYTNETEVIRDAVRRMRESRENELEKKRERLREAIQLGIDDIEAGRFVKYDKNFMKRLSKEVKKRRNEPLDFDPDVVGPEGQEPWI